MNIATPLQLAGSREMIGRDMVMDAKCRMKVKLLKEASCIRSREMLMMLWPSDCRSTALRSSILLKLLHIDEKQNNAVLDPEFVR